MRAARMRVTRELLESVLRMPSGMHIVGVMQGQEPGSKMTTTGRDDLLTFVVTHDALPASPDLNEVPLIEPALRREIVHWKAGNIDLGESR